MLVPKNQQVLSVNGQNVKEWTLKPERRAVSACTSICTRPAKDNYSAAIRLEAALAALPQQVSLPVIQAQGVERQSGTLGDLGRPGDGRRSRARSKDSPSRPRRQTNGRYAWARRPLPLSAPAVRRHVSVTEAKPQVEVASETLLRVTPETAGAASAV